MKPDVRPVRCAIYTRKSSDEGLEQDFNSLHAQREACAAYVASQASEGWQLLPEAYDDGGISGGTLERPALQQLLADIAAGKIDIVVVYKVDRLTRSLLDFAKLVEAFDKAGTSFVSITQSFNTTTSMGRLTLNMLLSFAQFEREVTAERIRDKLAASKAKGMWMGGMPPLGYKADGRTLALVEPHAALIRDIYARYLELGNVREVAEQFAAKGIVVPQRKAGTGRRFGGNPFTRGQLYAILKNPIYAGDIPHKDKVFAGNHPPLIERGLWDQVQRRLSSQVKGTRGKRAPVSSPLAGKLFDAGGEPLLASHTTRPAPGGAEEGKQRYRYYVSKALHQR
jgi:site-specific DNA recombinase